MIGVLFLPLIALGLLQVTVALLLLAPLPLARPVLRLSKHLKTPVGWTMIGTVSAILLIFLASSLIEIGDLHSHRKDKREIDAVHQRYCTLLGRRNIA